MAASAQPPRPLAFGGDVVEPAVSLDGVPQRVTQNPQERRLRVAVINLTFVLITIRGFMRSWTQQLT